MTLAASLASHQAGSDGTISKKYANIAIITATTDDKNDVSRQVVECDNIIKHGERFVNYLKSDQLEDHLSLEAFSNSERQAILEHKYFLGIELGFDPGIVAAIESWQDNHADQWRKSKMQRDSQRQIQQIYVHRDEMSADSEPKVEIELAARDWICNCANNWRETNGY